MDTPEHRSNRGALVIAGSILATGIAIGAAIYLSRAESPRRVRRGSDEIEKSGS